MLFLLVIICNLLYNKSNKKLSTIVKVKIDANLYIGMQREDRDPPNNF